MLVIQILTHKTYTYNRHSHTNTCGSRPNYNFNLIPVADPNSIQKYVTNVDLQVKNDKEKN